MIEGIPMKTLTTFNKLKSLTSDVRRIRTALEKSDGDVVEVRCTNNLLNCFQGLCSKTSLCLCLLHISHVLHIAAMFDSSVIMVTGYAGLPQILCLKTLMSGETS